VRQTCRHQPDASRARRSGLPSISRPFRDRCAPGPGTRQRPSAGWYLTALEAFRAIPARARLAVCPPAARGARWHPGHRVNPVDGMDLAGEVVRCTHRTEVPANATASSGTVCRANHGASSAPMAARWVYRPPRAQKSASSTRSRKAKVLASLVVLARSANCSRVNTSTLTLPPSAVAKSRAKPPYGYLPVSSSRTPADWMKRTRPAMAWAGFAAVPSDVTLLVTRSRKR